MWIWTCLQEPPQETEDPKKWQIQQVEQSGSCGKVTKINGEGKGR